MLSAPPGTSHAAGAAAWVARRCVVRGMGGAGAKDRPRYIRTSQLIVVSSPEGDTVTAYSTETGKAKSLRLAKASDTKLEVQPIVSQGLAALYLKGPNITRIAAFSVLDGTWYAQDLREPVDKAVPVVSQSMAAYGIGRRIYAFSPVAKRWDVLELPEGVVADAGHRERRDHLRAQWPPLRLQRQDRQVGRHRHSSRPR